MEIIIAAIIVAIAVFGTGFYLLAEIRSSKRDNKDVILLNEQLARLTDRVDDRLDKSSVQMHKIIGDVTRDLTELKQSNKQVMSITDELKLLQNTLQNPKQRGVLGEYFLQTVLENVMPPGSFDLQYKLGKDDDGKDLVVDAVIKLDGSKVLPVDAKFSLENYNRLVEETDRDRQMALLKSIKNDLKLRIDETSRYIKPAYGTMDFAFMYIPSEAIYYDLIINKVGTLQTNSRDLIEYAFRQKNVIIVSPTTFMAYLQTVLQGLRSLKIEERAKEIEKRVGELGRHLVAHETYMQKLGSSLGTTVNHYNAAHKELGKVDKDVIRIAETTPAIEPVVIDKPLSDD